jgi:hypothetical protein
MPQSIPRAPARLHSPAPKRLNDDEDANTAVITVAGIGTITLTGLIVWFFAGSIMMTMPGIVGFMGFIAAVAALVILVATFWPRN